MKTIAVMNQKGGTGKTTSAINLAGELVRRGKKVLIVDMDTQGNATSNLSLTEIPAATLTDVIVSKTATLADTVCHTTTENLDLIRGGSLLAPALATMQEMPFGRDTTLRRLLPQIPDTYDFVFFDCSPSLESLFNINVLVAVQYVLIPIKVDKNSIEGYDVMLETIQSVREIANPDIRALGIFMMGILYVLEFLYAKRLPLLEILLGTEGFVHFGGIPTIHVLLVTYTVFFSTFIFHRLICNFSRKLLYNFLIIAFFPPLLMVNRGMLFTIFFACLFVYLFSLKAFKRKILIYCIISISLALYLFSIIGSVRINDDENSTVFVAFTQPTDDFESLGISNMFLWPYMYIASPIGNLQNCIDIYQPTGSFSTFFWKCICPDFISKHFYKSELESPPLISPVFNVSTMYTDAYAQLGYLGMGILFVMQTFVLYTVLLAFSAKKNPYYTTTVSLSCSVVILNAFANMWTFSAISFPIIWGPISYFLRKIRW